MAKETVLVPERFAARPKRNKKEKDRLRKREHNIAWYKALAFVTIH